jgi:hypothetical protein
VTGTVEAWVPGGAQGLSTLLFGSQLTLADAAHAVKRLAGPAHDVEGVGDDLSVWELCPHRVAERVIEIDADHRDAVALGLAQGAQVALHDSPGAPVEHLVHAPSIEV